MNRLFSKSSCPYHRHRHQKQTLPEDTCLNCIIMSPPIYAFVLNYQYLCHLLLLCLVSKHIMSHKARTSISEEMTVENEKEKWIGDQGSHQASIPSAGNKAPPSLLWKSITCFLFLYLFPPHIYLLLWF